MTNISINHLFQQISTVTGLTDTEGKEHVVYWWLFSDWSNTETESQEVKTTPIKENTRHWKISHSYKIVLCILGKFEANFIDTFVFLVGNVGFSINLHCSDQTLSDLKPGGESGSECWGLVEQDKRWLSSRSSYKFHHKQRVSCRLRLLSRQTFQNLFSSHIWNLCGNCSWMFVLRWRPTRELTGIKHIVLPSSIRLGNIHSAGSTCALRRRLRILQLPVNSSWAQGCRLDVFQVFFNWFC